MEIFAGLSVLTLILAALFIAIKTFSLWLRTRGLPELLLSLMLMGATVTGYPLAIGMTLIPASQNWVVHVAAEVAMSFGFSCLLLFTLNVFRANTLWARCLVGLCLAMLVATAVGYSVNALSENPLPPVEMPGLALANSAPVAIAYFWTTAESLSYYRKLKLQLRLGLTEAVVANRVLLWGLMTLAAGTALVFNMVALTAGYFLSMPIVAVSSLLGLVHAGCLFFAFHPPGWYRVWVERRAAMEAA